MEIADKAEKAIKEAKQSLVQETNKAKEAMANAEKLKESLAQLEKKAAAEHAQALENMRIAKEV